MPGLDGNGPEGKGTMTGRGLGRCKDGEFKSPPGFGRGPCRGFGYGRGRGARRGYRPYHGRGFGRFGLAVDPTDPESKKSK